MAGAIYLPPDLRYEGLREMFMGPLMGMVQQQKQKSLQDQISAFMGALPGNAPTLNPDVTLSAAGPNTGNPLAPPDLSGLSGMTGPQEFDLQKVMSNITDPGLAKNLFPVAADMWARSQPKPENRVKLTAWKVRKDGSYEPREFYVSESAFNNASQKLQNAGYIVSDKEPSSPKISEKQVVRRVQVGNKTYEATYNVAGYDDNGTPILEMATAGGRPLMGEVKEPKTEINIDKVPESIRTSYLDYTKGVSLITQMKDMYSKLPQFKGIAGKAASYGENFLAKIGAAPDVQAYNSFVDGTVAPLVRSLGEKGNLSDTDIERAIKLIPKYPVTQEEAEKRFKALDDLMGKVGQNISQAAVLGVGKDTPKIDLGKGIQIVNPEAAKLYNKYGLTPKQ
jgi:hypothetical protein